MMNLRFLAFLAEPWWVVPWYAVGLVGALWVIRDTHRANDQLGTALRWAYPIIVLFFSVLGLALYLASARAPGIGRLSGDDAREAHHRFVSHPLRKVTASVIHCVGGDGLGIVTAMVIARVVGVKFWVEYWFEYAVGFGFGWFIFQFLAMRKMADSPWKALWMGGRAETFSMSTVMAGMGAVMGFVTPLVVGEQPRPDTAGFWGFAALGLMVGFVVTFPMNAWLVRIGWKHGMS